MPAGRPCIERCTGDTCRQPRCCLRRARSSPSRTTRCFPYSPFVEQERDIVRASTLGRDWQCNNLPSISEGKQRTEHCRGHEGLHKAYASIHRLPYRLRL